MESLKLRYQKTCNKDGEDPNADIVNSVLLDLPEDEGQEIIVA